MLSHRAAALLAALSLSLLPACGSDDESGGGGSGGSEEPTAVAVEITESGKKSTVKFPKSVEAGLVELSYENSGKAPHSVQLARVDGDQTAAQVKKVGTEEGAPIPDWIHGAGGVGTVAPGQSGTATVVLEPGSYYAEDDEGDEGGIAKFEVTGEATESELPSTDATIVASEYKFETTGLKAGANTVTFDNAGEELHHAIAAPIAEGKSIADVKKFFMSDGRPSGPPPVDFEGAAGTAILDGGVKEVTDLELKAGRYAFVCFIPDRAGGPPHFVKGMLQEVKIPG